ncbi:GNAT family N-acetyltransferase [Ahrensia sp. 13_GOM-1096m]|uniref:GNAT family N-acetyltransferase n=1 Tax=Ahrensia sp. 13_GOM-1096m TaxID=1380380 RepID=UPI00047AD6E4|nr:hypothetical protein [Ahrensia sp. 13_GOM-1096m]
MSKAQDHLKNMKLGRSSASLPVIDRNGYECAQLVPIGKADTQDDYLIKSIFKWRNRHMESFATRIANPSIEKTRSYLENIPIGKPDRILFRLIAKGKLVGHVGLCSVNNTKICDIDNLMIGEVGLGLELAMFCELTLLHFCFDQLDVSEVAADVLNTNRAAYGLHRLVGMKVKERIPLIATIKENGDEFLTPRLSSQRLNSDVFFNRMTVNRELFMTTHKQWIEGLKAI